MPEQIEKCDTGQVDMFALALERTSLAYERTLMAWIRTAMSLIAFGFTVYKFFQFEEIRGGLPLEQFVGPSRFALIMISIGILYLMMASVQHRMHRNNLRRHYPELPHSPASWAAAITSLFGLAAMLAVIFGI